MESADNPADRFDQEIFVNPDAMRMEMQTDEGYMIAIFRHDKGVFWMINKDEGKYIEMTRYDLKQVRQQMDQMMKQMEEQLQNLPPEQRAMMEGMMKSQMPEQPQEPVYTKVDSGLEVGEWTCDQYKGEVEGAKTSDLWTVDWTELGIQQEELAVMRTMGEFFVEIAPNEAGFLQTGGAEPGEESPGKYQGLPVKVVSYTEGKADFLSTMKIIEQREFSPDLFELPEGYTKEEMMPSDMGE
jgi:hypothetical protein